MSPSIHKLVINMQIYMMAFHYLFFNEPQKLKIDTPISKPS